MHFFTLIALFALFAITMMLAHITVWKIFIRNDINNSTSQCDNILYYNICFQNIFEDHVNSHYSYRTAINWLICKLDFSFEKLSYKIK